MGFAVAGRASRSKTKVSSVIKAAPPSPCRRPPLWPAVPLSNPLPPLVLPPDPAGSWRSGDVGDVGTPSPGAGAVNAESEDRSAPSPAVAPAVTGAPLARSGKVTPETPGPAGLGRPMAGVGALVLAPTAGVT